MSASLEVDVGTSPGPVAAGSETAEGVNPLVLSNPPDIAFGSLTVINPDVLADVSSVSSHGDFDYHTAGSETTDPISVASSDKEGEDASRAAVDEECE